MQESQDFKPVGRRGVCSFVHNSSFYLYGGAFSTSGVPPFNQTPHVDIEMLDMHSGLWSSVKTKALHSLPQCTSGACCAVLNDNLYVFGGWLAGLRNAHIHELDLETFCWRELPIKNPENGPICKDKAAMFGYGEDMIGVFGGYGGYPVNDANARLGGRAAQYHLDTTAFFDIYWTNELHLFHVGKSEWIIPVITGIPPPPCAAFSITRVDPHRLVIFGGKQVNSRVNEIHILNLDTWDPFQMQHWSGVNLASRPEEPWPVGRSFHTACSLFDQSAITPPYPPCGTVFEWLPCPTPDLSPCGPAVTVDPKLIVLWGMNNDADPIDDAWELNVNTLTWKQVHLPGGAGPRVWHTASAYHPSPCEAMVVAFGGTSENMFEVPQQQLTVISKPSLFHCGVRCLLELCLDNIIQDEILVSHHDHLPIPAHLQQQIREQVTSNQQLSITKL